METMKIQVSIPPMTKQNFKLCLVLGPGTYAAEKVKVVGTVKDMMSNSFSTKVSIRKQRETKVNFCLDSSFLPNSPWLKQLQTPVLLDQPWSRNSFPELEIHWAALRLRQGSRKVPDEQAQGSGEQAHVQVCLDPLQESQPEHVYRPWLRHCWTCSLQSKFLSR